MNIKIKMYTITLIIAMVMFVLFMGIGFFYSGTVLDAKDKQAMDNVNAWVESPKSSDEIVD